MTLIKLDYDIIEKKRDVWDIYFSQYHQNATVHFNGTNIRITHYFFIFKSESNYLRV